MTETVNSICAFIYATKQTLTLYYLSVIAGEVTARNVQIKMGIQYFVCKLQITQKKVCLMTLMKIELSKTLPRKFYFRTGLVVPYLTLTLKARILPGPQFCTLSRHQRLYFGIAFSYILNLVLHFTIRDLNIYKYSS